MAGTVLFTSTERLEFIVQTEIVISFMDKEA